MMLKGKLGYILLVFALAAMSGSMAQNISNVGRDFWVIFPRHEPNGSVLASMRLLITSKNNSSGVVKIGTATIPFTVSANMTTVVDIPRSLAYLNSLGYFSNRGIHVIVNADQPKVVVYANIAANARSASTLVLPSESLGASYYVMGYDQHGTSGAGYFNYSIVATEPNTRVLIRKRINHVVSAVVEVITLTNVGDVYQFLGVDDYTGTYAEVDPATSACKTFAMFSGSSGISIPFDDNGSLNPLFQQLYSVNNWGKKYAYVPFSGPDQGGILCIIAQEDNTMVSIDGISSPIVLNKGAFYNSLPLPTARMITANKPISIAQFALSEKFSDSRNINLGPTYLGPYPIYSDPTMVLLNPLEFSTRDITVYSSTMVGITSRFINVVMKTSAISTFKVNGAAPVGAIFTSMGGGYSYIQLNLAIPAYGGSASAFSSIRLTANEGFNAVVYGFGDYDAYAYAAGTNLSANSFLTVTDNATQQALTSGCKNQSLNMKVTLPYTTSELRWTLDSNMPTITQANPAYTTIVSDGNTLYEYQLPTNSFITNGNKEIKVSVKVPSIITGCNDDFMDFAFSFHINNTPEAKFTALTQSCVNVPIVFNDTSTRTDSDIIQWAWNFGDGATTSTRSPAHTYAAAGTYTVTLNITVASGCTSVFTQLVTIGALPVADFSNNTIVCQNYPVSFTDNSTSVDGVITRWNWNFGDGQIASVQNPTHTFTQGGTYTVRLTTTTDKGCESVAVAKNILVNASPEVNFEAPAICLLDATASFTNTTIIADGTGASLTYLWNFGDPNSSALNPLTSTLKNPSHIYSATGSYTVTLTVASSNGCSATLSRPFLVNGDVPNAAFLVLNNAQLCSSEAVVFEDKASVDFGEIVRLEWYYDFDNAPSDIVVDDNPNLRSAPSKQYTHQYPIFYTPSTKTYIVKMAAYSGHACVSEITRTLELKAVPQVIFDALSSVCQDRTPFLLSAREVNSAAGSKAFTGNGVSANGMFKPALAGPGDHLITYTFTGLNGCVAKQAQTITVNPLPVVNAGADQILLYGERHQLVAHAVGNNVTCKWSPTVGLNRDDIPNPVASPTENITYTLLVTSADGCTEVDQVSIQVLQTLQVPNTFTPNGDDSNNVWVIGNLDNYPGAIVEVFNRNGRRVFRSEGNYVPWDGKMNSEDVPAGTYYYFIDPKNRRIPIFGSITILR